MKELWVVLLAIPVLAFIALGRGLEPNQAAPPPPVTPVVIAVAPGPAGAALAAGQAPVPAAGVAPAGATPTPLPIGVAIAPTTDRFNAVFAFAKTWLGVPYLFGGCSRSGVDCSCAVRIWYASAGVNLQRTTLGQKATLPAVPLSALQPGDILFFDNTCTDCGPNPTHEAMAIGNGMMIQAGGANVNIRSYTTGFYAAHLSSAARVP